MGKTVTFRGEAVPIRRVEPVAFKGVDIAFFSAGSAQAREYAPMIVKAGAIVIESRMRTGWTRRCRSSFPRSTRTRHALTGESWRARTARRS